MEDQPPLNLVCRSALELQEFCLQKNWKFCFIGGLAVLAWALPRNTVDADLTLLTGFGDEEAYVDALLERFAPRTDGTGEFALRSRVLLLQSQDGIGLDIGLGAIPFEENSITRSVLREVVPGCQLRVCSAEDLIVHKAFASRDQDWADIDSVLMTRGSRLNVRQILQELTPLVELKEDASILPRLHQLMEKREVTG